MRPSSQKLRACDEDSLDSFPDISSRYCLQKFISKTKSMFNEYRALESARSAQMLDNDLAERYRQVCVYTHAAYLTLTRESACVSAV
jgi:hypothetical protein